MGGPDLYGHDRYLLNPDGNPADVYVAWTGKTFLIHCMFKKNHLVAPTDLSDADVH